MSVEELSLEEQLAASTAVANYRRNGAMPHGSMQELSLAEQLAASTAVANYRRENMPLNGTANGGGDAPPLAIVAMNNQPIRPQFTAASALMPIMDIDAAYERWSAIQEFIGRIMGPDDYGVIPGSKKPSLLKPGAEKLTAFFGLAPEFDVVQRIEQWDSTEPFFHYEIKCRLSRDGAVRGEGLGSCNSRESKYRYRNAERTCPSCGGSFIIKGRAEYGGGWLCFAKKGGCGAKYGDGDQSIEGQEVGRVANPDIADQVNTLLKMAKKRALIDAVLNTTGASQFFTQDVEDQHAPEPQPEPPMYTREAQQAVASRKIEELRRRTQAAPAWPEPEKAWTTRGQMKEIFSRLREAVGEVEFAKEMEFAGVQSPADFRYLNDARASYARLVEMAKREGK